MLTWLCTILLLIVGFLLMFIVLLQRGRGGGLAGAFGGAGGHSAFGTKAGDVFTKITVVMAVIWVVLAGVTGFAMRYDAENAYQGGKDANKSELVGDQNAGAGGAAGETPPPAKTDEQKTPVAGKTAAKTPDAKTDGATTPAKKTTPAPKKTMGETSPAPKKDDSTKKQPANKKPAKKQPKKTGTGE